MRRTAFPLGKIPYNEFPGKCRNCCEFFSAAIGHHSQLIEIVAIDYFTPPWQRYCSCRHTRQTCKEEARNMGSIRLRFRNVPTAVLGVTSLLLCLGGPLHARIAAAPNRPAQTEDASRLEIDNFNRFLEGHQEVAVQLHNTPWLVDNPEYLRDHPELKSYLQDHPGVRQSISENPVAFMKEDAQRSELAQFSRFLDAHPDIAEQLRRDPKLADGHNFMQAHPDLRTYLDEHQTVKVALHENTTTFMQEEEGYNRNTGGHDMEMSPASAPNPSRSDSGQQTRSSDDRASTDER
jgi:hypothetical protein